MAAHRVHTLIYSSTCATYGEPEKMPITEVTPQVRVLYDFSSNFIKYIFFRCFSFQSINIDNALL